MQQSNRTKQILVVATLCLISISAHAELPTAWIDQLARQSVETFAPVNGHQLSEAQARTYWTGLLRAVEKPAATGDRSVITQFFETPLERAVKPTSPRQHLRDFSQSEQNTALALVEVESGNHQSIGSTTQAKQRALELLQIRDKALSSKNETDKRAFWQMENLFGEIADTNKLNLKINNMNEVIRAVGDLRKKSDGALDFSKEEIQITEDIMRLESDLADQILIKSKKIAALEEAYPGYRISNAFQYKRTIEAELSFKRVAGTPNSYMTLEAAPTSVRPHTYKFPVDFSKMGIRAARAVEKTLPAMAASAALLVIMSDKNKAEAASSVGHKEATESKIHNDEAFGSDSGAQ